MLSAQEKTKRWPPSRWKASLPAAARVTEEKPQVANAEPSEVTSTSLWSFYTIMTFNLETSCTQPQPGVPGTHLLLSPPLWSRAESTIFQKQWQWWPLAHQLPMRGVSGDDILGLGSWLSLSKTLTPCPCGHQLDLVHALQT